jgi:hypothetical protein
MFVAYRFFNIGMTYTWPIWIITFWLFLFILHFIRVFITNRFMNKNWERTQIDRLVALQQKKITKLQTEIKDQIKE